MCLVVWHFIIAAVWLVGVAPRVAQGAQATGPSQESKSARTHAGNQQSLAEFRRVFVPADRIDEVTHNHERFLPIPREEFQRLTEEYQEDRVPPPVRITRAKFSARLEGNSLVQGSAELEIEHLGERPAWLPLQMRGIAPADLHWVDGRPTRSGTYHGPDAVTDRRLVAGAGSRGETGVVVTDAGTLHFDWTARGTSVADGTEFRLTLPRAVATDLILILPSTTRLSVDGASVRSRSSDASGGTAYRVAVRGGASFVLRTDGQTAARSDTQGGLAVRHITTYTVTASATQVDSQLRVAPFVQPVRELSIRVPTSMRVLALTLGGQPLPFTERPAADGGDQKLLFVELDQPLPPGETELRVRGMMTARLDRLLALPSFRLAQGTWLSGTVHLELDEGLQLHDLVHDGFRPNGTDDGERGPPNRWTFEQTAGVASLQVQVGRAPKRLAVRALTSVEIGREQVLADATVDVTCENGIESILRADLAEDWEIGSVESQPAGLVRSWSVERSGEGDGARRSISVVLDRPVTPMHPVRVEFRARRQRSVDDEGFSIAQLALLEWTHISTASQWVEVLSGSTLEVISDSMASAQTVGSDELPVALQGLVSERLDAYLLAVRPETEGIVFRTRPRSADVTAEIQLDAEVTGSAVRHAYRFRIQPQSGAVSRLGVYFSDPPPDVFQWQLLDRTGRELAAERSSIGGDGRRPARGLRWRISQPIAGPFELLLSFERAWEGAGELNFAAVESAGSQTGEVWLSADSSLKLAVENRGLEPLDSGPASEEVVRRRSFAYRFQPERVLRRDAEPPLVIRRVAAEDLIPAAWIRTARLDSVYLPDGGISNTLSVVLENNGSDQLSVHLPQADRILFRTANGAWRQLARASRTGPVGIPLNGATGTVPLEIRFSTRQRPLRSVASLERVPIRFSNPATQIERRVWVPPGYHSLELSGSADRVLAGLHVLWLSDEAVSASPDAFDGSAPAWELQELKPTTRVEEFPIVHMTTLRLWCLAMLVLGFMVGSYLGRIGRRLGIVAAAGGLGAALLLPVPYVLLASALAWGCIAAVLMQAIILPLASLLLQYLPAGTRPQEVAATAAVLLLGLYFSRDGSSAELTRGDSSARIQRVIDPIGEDRRPVGDHVFVPESLYAALLRREREVQAPLGHWLITRSRVRGALAEDVDAAAMGSQAFSVALELETFRRDAEVRLPFVRGPSSVRVTTIRVDGATPASRWSEDGRSLYVRIPQPGPHHLELQILPHIHRKGGSRELSLPLVPTEECYVEVAVPEEMPPLMFPGAEGHVHYAPAGSTYRGHVGPVPELRIAWPSPGGASAGTAQADLLTWMYVQKTVAFIEQRLVVHAEGSEPLYVDVVPPAGARYVPSGRELSYASVSAGANGRVTLAIQPQEAESVVVPLQFLQEHPTGATSIAVPRFGIEGNIQVVDRWLAIHAAPHLTLRPEPGTNAEIVEPGAFLDRWGPADSLPEMAFRAYPDATSWRIGLDASAPYVEASESTTAIASPSGIAIRYRADVRVLDGAIMLRRLDVPCQMIVSDIEIAREGTVHSARWSQGEEGRLRILFPEPISGSFTLRVDGEVPVGEGGDVELPLLALDAERSDSPRLTVARTAGTSLELERSDALQPIGGALPPTPWRDDWYLYGQYVGNATSKGASLVRGTVHPTRPPREARVVTSLAPESRSWTIGVHCLLRGVQQPLDRLVFVAPKEWRGPYEVDPAGRWRVEVREESLYNRIVLRPLAPPAGEIRLTLRGQLAADRHELVTIPAIRLVEPVADDRIVALPKRTSSGQPAVWQIPNHIVVEDAAAGELIGGAGEWALYRPSADPTATRISLVEQSLTAPLVSFVEVVTRLSRTRQIFSEATFTLDPRGRWNCEMLVPEEHRLLDVRVNGRTLSSHRVAPRRWKVQLDSSQLPQLITVAYRSESALAGENRRLHVPRLVAEGKEITVLQTAWHLLPDRPWKPDVSADGTSRISGSMLAAVRTANLVESLDEILPALVASPIDSWDRWLAYWRSRIAAAQDRYDAYARFEPTDKDATQAVQSAQQGLARIAEALPQLPRTADVDPVVDLRRPPFQPPRSRGAYDVYLLGDGGVESIRVRIPQDPRDETVHRWMGAVLLGLIGVGLVRSYRGEKDASHSWGIALPLSLLFVLGVGGLLAESLGAVLAALAAVILVIAWDVRYLVGRRGSNAAGSGL